MPPSRAPRRPGVDHEGVHAAVPGHVDEPDEAVVLEGADPAETVALDLAPPVDGEHGWLKPSAWRAFSPRSERWPDRSARPWAQGALAGVVVVVLGAVVLDELRRAGQVRAMIATQFG